MRKPDGFLIHLPYCWRESKIDWDVPYIGTYGSAAASALLSGHSMPPQVAGQ